MRKKLLLGGIVIWGIISVCIIGIIIGIARNGGIRMFGEATVVKQESIDCTGIHDLEIESGSCGIKIISTTAPDITVKQYGGRSLNKKELFEASVGEGKLKIKQEYMFRLINISFDFNQKLVVEVPKDWSGNVSVKNSSGGIVVDDFLDLKEFNAKNSSGGIRINSGMTAENITLKATSGGIHLEGKVTVKGELDLKSNSGGIKAEQVTEARRMTIKTTSGGIKLEKAEVDEFDIQCSSGGVKAGYLTGGGRIKTTSGGIKVNLNELTEDVDIKASSGGVKVYTDRDASFHFSGKCSSGGIKADFPMDINDSKNKATAEVGENPSVSIQVQTSSGGIRMYQE